ncbi:hypothetical protein C479_07808 [Halovivax asiaticus JCM 14624]|uniref:Uncharacterized protein n=1 Tax=Halovivax asiaticus JCM 14624 TaxID=1227490 RepID=M0BM48_9EURY|nr:hypothetical protein C479_07808 [Halovivax asiaticus JCM 14624]
MESESMKEYEFTCPACGQQIEINGPMRTAILSNGCPICSASVGDDNFAPA